MGSTRVSTTTMPAPALVASNCLHNESREEGKKRLEDLRERVEKQREAAKEREKADKKETRKRHSLNKSASKASNIESLHSPSTETAPPEMTEQVQSEDDKSIMSRLLCCAS